MKINIFLDMDGVLARYHPKTPQLMYNRGHFEYLPPQKSMIELARRLLRNDNFNVYILSSILQDNLCAVQEKSSWLDKFLPELPINNRIFVPVGIPKTEYVKEFDGLNVLIDDFTVNLLKWEEEGMLGIKVYNQLNGTKGIWAKGHNNSISIFEDVDKSYKTVLNIIYNEIEKED